MPVGYCRQACGLGRSAGIEDTNDGRETMWLLTLLQRWIALVPVLQAVTRQAEADTSGQIRQLCNMEQSDLRAALNVSV